MDEKINLKWEESQIVLGWLYKHEEFVHTANKSRKDVN